MGVVLLVGGAGYVGSVLANELIERGQRVRILDRLYFGDHGLSEIRDRVELVVGDMRTVDSALLDDVESIINVGGLSNDPTAEYNPRANYEMNTTATVSLAKLAKKAGVRRYLLASSCSIYDRGVGDESRDILLDESSDVDPPGAYGGSKLAAEAEILPLASDSFCAVAMRKATLFGFSPRMRYDLVVNTFVKDALTSGAINLHYGGEMWRPLADVRDAARGYLALLRADQARVNGQVFNLVHRNYRISELALRVRGALRGLGIDCDINTDYAYRGVRNYRVSGQKMADTVKFEPDLSVEDAVKDMVEGIERLKYTDFGNPRYYNIQWMRLLEEAHSIIQVTGGVFDIATAGTPRPQQAGS